MLPGEFRREDRFPAMGIGVLLSLRAGRHDQPSAGFEERKDDSGTGRITEVIEDENLNSGCIERSQGRLDQLNPKGMVLTCGEGRLQVKRS